MQTFDLQQDAPATAGAAFIYVDKAGGKTADRLKLVYCLQNAPKLEGTLMRKAVKISEIWQFVVDAATNLEYGLLATWLAKKVEGCQVERITINRRIVRRFFQLQ